MTATDMKYIDNVYDKKLINKPESVEEEGNAVVM
jgi:hypothetical protein